ncbi:MAG: S53 family peptidase [Solirubrobacterales bacterium]|nr:S53 family peptidase [Solirubrobacterales bacterium]
MLAICGYNAKQIRSAYGAQKLYRNGADGSGTDIGIVTGYLSPTLQSDLDAYSHDNGIARTRLRSTGLRVTRRPIPARSGTSISSRRSTPRSSRMAPGARIHYEGPDGINIDKQIAAVSDLVDRNRVEVVSNSWGAFEVEVSKAYYRAGEDVFMQAAVQGITMLYASGDNGDGIDTLGIRSVWYPASSRWVTAVGGTTLSVGPTNQRVWEQGWGESVTQFNEATSAWDPEPPGTFFEGSTGGASRVFRQPGYQRGKVPKRYSSYFGGHARVVPDVALIADPMSGPGLVQTAFNPTTGADVVVRRSIGGTSVAAPVFAGAVAAMADRNGERLGFLNPSLYRARDRAIRPVGPARKPAVSAQAFYTNHLDASDGFEFVLFSGGQYGTLEVRKGYDDVTGLGSPSARILAKGLRRMSR